MEDIIFTECVKQDSYTKKQFTCEKVTIKNNSQWMQEVKNIAKNIEKNLNPGQANSSIIRNTDAIEIDNFSGVIAEYACFEFLKKRLGEIVIKPSSNSSKNQIDIMVGAQNKTIEVRSSFINNGIEFALFSDYIDVIGPYTNEYKRTENEKDFYMRVLYGFSKADFDSKLNDAYLELYITGGATKEMMDKAYIIKHMKPACSNVEHESDYKVIPLKESLDILNFINSLEYSIYNKKHIIK